LAVPEKVDIWKRAVVLEGVEIREK
jgi:hypothetical protein